MNFDKFNFTQGIQKALLTFLIVSLSISEKIVTVRTNKIAFKEKEEKLGF